MLGEAALQVQRNRTLWGRMLLAVGPMFQDSRLGESIPQFRFHGTQAGSVRKLFVRRTGIGRYRDRTS